MPDPKRGKGRGVVCTCSYEAREYGIHSAMPVSQAYKLCPDAKFLPVNIRLYVQVSDNVMEIMKGINRINPKYHFTNSKCLNIFLLNWEKIEIKNLTVIE